MSPRFLVLLVLASSLAIAAPISIPTPNEMLARIKQEGGKKVLWEIFENEPLFEAMLAPVERADPEWIEVWRQLRPYSDAAASEEIDIAVARALPVAPERVLGLVGNSGFTLEFVCTSPFIEPEPGVAEEYERRTLQALAKVTDPKLKPLAAKCAKAVKLPAHQ